MELNVSIDYKAFAEAFNAFPIEAAKELREAMKKGAKAIARDAHLHHRFKTKSGRLENSIMELIKPDGLSGIVFINESKAGYGKFVHDGTEPHVIRAKNAKALYFVKGGTGFMVPKVPHKVPSWMIKSGEVGNNMWGNGKASPANMKWSQKGYVNHPGTKPDRFLYQAAARQEPYFIARINGAIKRVIEAFK